MLAERRRRSQLGVYRALGSAAPGSACVQVRPGVQACVVPCCPDRSITNAVVYTDAAALLEAHDELLELYAGAGVRAWTVWVVPGDDELGAALEARGHLRDSSPEMMVAPMSEIDLDGAGDPALDLDPVPSWPLIGRLNDLAYGLPPGTLEPVVVDMDDPRMRAFITRLSGEPVAGLATYESPEGDCALEFVATAPQARGRGLAAALLRHALRGARERGCTSVSLEASAMGRPVYERLGYRAVGTMGMYEHRRA